MISAALVKKVMAWHSAKGGHKGNLAAHSLKMLDEMVELCVAMGATQYDIDRVAIAATRKAYSRGEFSYQDSKANFDERRRDELADVGICYIILARYAGYPDIQSAIQIKLAILENREWESDDEGVVRRPGRPRMIPKPE